VTALLGMRTARTPTTASAPIVIISRRNRSCASSWIAEWNRFTAAGQGDRPNHSIDGLSISGSAAPAMPAITANRCSGRATAASRPIVASPVRPSGTATLMKWRRLRQSPQCGSASSAKCDATPIAKAGTGRRVSAPITAPDRT
jgi:hypothetical protein